MIQTQDDKELLRIRRSATDLSNSDKIETLKRLRKEESVSNAGVKVSIVVEEKVRSGAHNESVWLRSIHFLRSYL